MTTSHNFDINVFQIFNRAMRSPLTFYFLFIGFRIWVRHRDSTILRLESLFYSLISSVDLSSVGMVFNELLIRKL